MRFRRPRLLPVGKPRPLSPTEAAALKVRPWPRLPWWLWLVAVPAAVAMVVVGVALLGGGPEEELPAAARRSPPTADLSHDVGRLRVPALEPANREVVERRRATCPRLARLTLVGTSGEVRRLSAAADRTCALRSTPAIERARDALDRNGVEVAFAEFELTGNESTTRFADGGALVLLNGKFSRSPPERLAALLVHEGTHVAAARPPTATDELAARRAELQACERLFGEDLAENRGCAAARTLLAMNEQGALAALREAGYR